MGAGLPMKPSLPPDVLPELLALRRVIHQTPELAGEERCTAETLSRFLGGRGPREVRTGLGGTGIAAVWDGAEPGPTVLLRAELDAVPVQESRAHPLPSQRPGASHACGHDGHMAILAGVADLLSRTSLSRGRVVLLFQPAEETGEGMARVLADPRFADLFPQLAFALHNLPGHPLGTVVIRDGSFAWASVGVAIRLEGSSSHAAHPEQGNSPGPALARLLLDLPAIPEQLSDVPGLVTPIHARLGEPAFGTSPATAVLMATLRTPDQEALDALRDGVEAAVRAEAERDDLRMHLERRDPFPATVNHPWCAARIREAAAAADLPVLEMDQAFRWTEDFGHLAARCPAALAGIGSGPHHPPLHHSEYEFPDALVAPSVSLFGALLERLLVQEPPLEVPCMPPP